MTDDFLRNPVSRRTFLARMTAAGLGTAAAALLAGCGGGGNSGGSTTPSPTGLTTFADQANFPNIPGANINLVVLNYALTLETLEADLYRQALNIAAGKDINAPLPAGNASSYALAVPTGGLDTTQTKSGFAYLQQFAYVEAAHRDYLRDLAIPQLGGTPVPPNAKGYSAASAGLVPGADLKTILTVILTAEETGVQAYLGSASFLTSAALVQQASSIYSTESRHSAVINLSLGNISAGATSAPGPSGSFGGVQPLTVPAGDTNVPILPGTAEFSKTPKQVLAAIQPFFVA